MTSRERWLAALRCQAVDRLPFWPKINDSYRSSQAAPFSRMTDAELHGWIGSDRHVGGPGCVKTIRNLTSTEQTQENGIRRTLFHTPAGTLTSVDRFDALSCSWHPREYPVKGPRDIEAMRWVFADVRLELDADELEKATALVRNLGEGGIAATGIGVSPLMDWLQHLAGIEQGLLLLTDCQADVQSLFEAMHRVLCRRAEIIADRAPYPIVYSVENTSTTIISPGLFRRYCLPHLLDYGRILSPAGKCHVLHMCGHLKAVLPDIASLPAAAIEAFTSPPVGNTTLLDGRAACPDKCLIGGTNAVLWLNDARTIIETLQRDLDALPDSRGVVVTSAGVMPPACNPQTIQQVGDWVKRYPVR